MSDKLKRAAKIGGQLAVATGTAAAAQVAIYGAPAIVPAICVGAVATAANEALCSVIEKRAKRNARSRDENAPS